MPSSPEQSNPVQAEVEPARSPITRVRRFVIAAAVILVAELLIMALLPRLHFASPSVAAAFDAAALSVVVVFTLHFALFRPMAVSLSALAQAKEALRLSDNRCRRLFETARDGILILDGNTGEITDVNPFLVEMLGYPRQELLGKKLWEAGVFKDLEACKAIFQMLGREGFVRYEHLMVEKRDGRLAEVEFVGHAHLVDKRRVIQCSLRDITERRLAEEELREASRKNALILESITDGFVAFDREWRFICVNSSAAKFLGLSRDQLLGRCVWEAWPEAARLRSGNEFRRAVAEKAVVQFEEYYPAPQEKWVNCRCYPSGGGLSVFLTDISERKRAEEQLHKTQECLLQTQKMEAVGQLAGGVAHEFNNLLSVINGQADLILRHLLEDDPLRSQIQVISNTGNRLAQLTRQIMAFSRGLLPRLLDLNEIVADTSKLLDALIPKNITVTVLPCPGLKSVKADPAQMGEMLVNLILNARDAMPQGGKLAIETANAELDEEFCRAHPGLHAGSYVLLSVSDTGCGMDENVKAHLFEPFFTATDAGEGTSLGLASVYNIVRQSGGGIVVHSTPGQGTTFQVCLPQAESEPAWPLRPSPQPVPRGTETVLMVEDEAEVRVIACEMLRALGYTVVSAGNGEEGLAAFQQHQEKIKMVITDVVMPGMNGPELVEHLCRQRSDIKVLFVSGYAEPVLSVKGRGDIAPQFLPKPIRLGALARKVREVLDGKC